MMRLLAVLACLLGMGFAAYAIFSAVTGDFGGMIVCGAVAGVSYFVAQGLAAFVD